MSDPKASYGEPVDEPTVGNDDVVTRAQAGLADAEAARSGVEPGTDPRERDDDGRDRSTAEPETVVVEETVVEERSEPTSASTPWYEKVDDDEARWAAYAASADVPDEPRPEEPVAERPHADAARPDDNPTVVAAPVAVTPSEPVTPGTSPSAFGAGAQPIFVQAPEAPRPRGNRGAAGAIGLLAAVVFAVLYLAATLAVGLLFRDFALDDILDETLAALTTWSLWVPVVVFYIAFWFLGALINRGAWGHWVVWGLLVGVAAWGGHILGQLFQAPFWILTAREGADLIMEQALAPLAIVAFVLGRELTIWFGAWVARRGRRITELNDEAQREYERTLEAGPQLRH
jgi:hypothetical protein